jgi:hypothetical protein
LAWDGQSQLRLNDYGGINEREVSARQAASESGAFGQLRLFDGRELKPLRSTLELGREEVDEDQSWLDGRTTGNWTKPTTRQFAYMPRLFGVSDGARDYVAEEPVRVADFPALA